LLRDKLGNADWDAHRGRADSWLVNSATAGLSIAQSLLEDERGILGKLVARMGEPVVRSVALAATRLLADHFVLGETIDDAIERAHREQLVCSFDMLGEAAKTSPDAERYFNAYSQAIEKVGSTNSRTEHAISVKLSALYPRYEPLQQKHAIPLIAEKLRHLALLAAQHNLQLTVDAEESERLEMSLHIFERVARMHELRDWRGMGLAVQAYQKRALPVLQWIGELSYDIHRPVKVRLVKGAYWDSEIKRCQQAGLNDYPVFTRKAFTDTSYLACAHFMLQSEF
ncbi:MAG: proline dehydrogenase family protein, partial [Steroidobacter sp.]